MHVPPFCPTDEDAAAAQGSDASETKQQRLARKAESARQARQRHKSSVQGLQDEVRTLSAQLEWLEAVDAAWRAQLRDDLRRALPTERFAQLERWLEESAARQQQQRQQQQQQQLQLQRRSETEGELSDDSPEMLLCALSMASPALTPATIGAAPPPLLTTMPPPQAPATGQKRPPPPTSVERPKTSPNTVMSSELEAASALGSFFTFPAVMAAGKPASGE